jgi:hypothetical protein
MLTRRAAQHAPASVIADTHRKRLSVNETLLAGVDEPQKMMAEIRLAAMK